MAKQEYTVVKDTKDRKQFRVCNMGANDELINQSEPLTSIDNVLKNILADARRHNKTLPRPSALRTPGQRLSVVKSLGFPIVYQGKNEAMKSVLS